jgi:hypothetical protein
MSIEAMKQALEALSDPWSAGPEGVADAITSLRQAIEQAEKQEPVAWITLESKWRLKGGGNAGGTVPVHAKQSSTSKYPLYTTPQPQRDTWKNAAIRLGEELSSVGPAGYYNMTAEQWLDWAIDQQPRGKNSLSQPQRKWVGLTDNERDDIWNRYCDEMGEASINDASDIVQAIEQALKEKNQ